MLIPLFYIRIQKIFLFLLPLFMLFLAITAQVRFDVIRQEHFNLTEPVHRFALPAPIVKYFSFGFQNVLADYYWAIAIQDFNKWDRMDTYYPEYFRIIAALDPKFEYPYFFGILTIPSKQNPESLAWISDLSEKGMEALPTSWEIPFYTGLQYHIIGKSYERSTEYLAIADHKPSRPEAVHTVYGLYLLHSTSDYQKSRAFFSAIYETSANEETKRIAQDRIALLDFIEMLDEASMRYHVKYMKYPSNLEELAKKGFVQLAPELVGRFQIQIDHTTGKATFK